MELVPSYYELNEHFLIKFTNEKSLTQHKEEHAATMLRDTENQKTPPAPPSKDGTNKKGEKLNSTKQDSSEVKATCPQCNQTFRRKFNMTIHIDRVKYFKKYISV